MGQRKSQINLLNCMDENLLNRRRQSADHSATQSEDDDSGNFEASMSVGQYD